MTSRIRVTFSIDGPMQFTGHLDLVRAWARLLRRAKLPVLYSQGFNPQPKINLAAALPLGFTSSCELIDILLDEELSLEEIEKRLAANAMPGLLITNVQMVDPAEKTLQSQLLSIEYRVTLDITKDLEEKITALLAADTIPLIRRGKSYDLRPLLESIRIIDKITLEIRLMAKPGKTGRPDQVLEALGLDPLSIPIHRTRLVFKSSQTE
ncbi:MAG: DUF2344 domain-containing protein [Anaerolineales bacterium]|nr:DUF2344 domain-containing protein [Anaerolineales bacterium]